MKFLSIFSLVLVLTTASCFGFKSPRVFGALKEHPEAKIKTKKFPYQTGLLVKDSDGEISWCGGSLIDHETVLTAAHCLEDIEEATVFLGANHKRLSPEVTHKVKKENFIIHSEWDSDDIKNDIALIKIPYTRYSENIQPVELPPIGTPYSSYDEEEVISSGWSHISNSSDISNDLVDWSSMYVIKNDKCAEYFGWVVSPSNVCISTYDLYSNCRGDTGGPLVLPLKSRMVQIGVNSFGSRKGCEKGTPTVFTRLTAYLEWIQSHTADSSQKKSFV